MSETASGILQEISPVLISEKTYSPSYFSIFLCLPSHRQHLLCSAPSTELPGLDSALGQQLPHHSPAIGTRDGNTVLRSSSEGSASPDSWVSGPVPLHTPAPINRPPSQLCPNACFCSNTLHSTPCANSPHSSMAPHKRLSSSSLPFLQVTLSHRAVNSHNLTSDRPH